MARKGERGKGGKRGEKRGEKRGKGKKETFLFLALFAKFCMARKGGKGGQAKPELGPRVVQTRH